MNKYLEEKFCFHCAPTIMGKKMSNLIILKNKFFLQRELVEYNKIFNEINLNIYSLKVCEKYTCVILYNIYFLQEILEVREIQDFLKTYSYEYYTTENALELLSKRITLENFPHEIGVFLGYPLEDVKGFIKNNGVNYLFSGY